VRKLVRDITWVAGADAGSRLLGFFITAYLARALGVSSFGVFSIGLASLGYLGQLTGAGFQLLEARNVAGKIPVNVRRTGSVVTLRATLAIIVVLLMVPVAGFLVENPETRQALILSSFVLIPLALSLEWFFQGKERFAIPAAAKVLNSLAYAFAVFFLVQGPGDSGAAILSLLFGQLCASLLTIASYRRTVGPLRPELDSAGWKKMLTGSLLLSLALLVAQSAVNLGPIVLGMLFSNREVGLFSAGMKLVVVLLLLDRVLNSLLLPVVSRVRATRPEETGRIVNIVMRISLLVVVPVSGICFIAAPAIIPVIFGSEFADASRFFRILLIYFAFTIPNSVFICTLLGCGQEQLYSRLVLAGSIILSLLVVAGAYLLGPIGAAVGVAVGEVLMCMLFMVKTERVTSVRTTPSFLRFLPPAMAMVAAIAALESAGMIGQLLLALTLFAVTVFFTRGVDREDLRLLRSRIT